MSMLTGTLVLPRMETDDPDGCLHCAERVAQQLRGLRGMISVRVIPAPVRLSYTYQPATLTPQEVETQATALLSDVEQRYIHRSFSIEGMNCDNCAQTLEKGICQLSGIEHAEVNFGSARMELEFDQSVVTIDRISKRVQELGYSIADAASGDETENGALWRLVRRRDNLLAVIAATLTMAGIIAWLAGAPTWLVNAGYLGAIAIGGVPLALKGLRALKTTRSPDINLLMTIAVVGALAIGEWLEGAAVVALFSLGEALEGYAMDRARRSIRSLMALTPATALVNRGGQEVELAVSEVVPGDQVTIRAGERVPVDGVVSRGTSSVDQASLTGESIPALKTDGDSLFAGTLNGNGPLTMRVTRLASDSSVARIIRMVEQAQGQRAPAQRLIDRFSRIYTPTVIVTAALIATVPPAFGASFSEWFYRALVLLVISCPCALVISTPVSIVSALSAAARRGILVKGGAALERAGAIDTVAFDKTGTLTTGQPAVTLLETFDGSSENQMLSLAASLEAHSEHPLGEAIRDIARRRKLPIVDLTEEQVVPGLGLIATINGSEMMIGSLRLFENVGRSPGVAAAIERIEQTGATPVLIGTTADILGVIGLADTPRPDAVSAIARLRALGVNRLVMLSGDRHPAAVSVARLIGIDDVRAELLPEHKLDAVAGLRGARRVVAMVGDGVNDAPSLAAADVGIAMGVAGTDVALETADIALMSDNLNGLADAIDLGRRARRKIWTNIAISLGVKVLFLTLALTGDATLWMAILADVGTSLVVIANGMLLLRWTGSSVTAESLRTSTGA
ncbi:MAG: cadmium-translocating P-type ATPase [Chloroflexia bacterium]|nr:cadmium-translocating P-type ATPase [Chloroflexia bacterium]